MQSFSVFTAPIFALFSRDFYRDVGRRWRGKSYFYLFLVLLLCWIAIVVSMATSIKTFFNEHGEELTKQIPPIHIRDGKVTADVPQPHYIRGDGKVIAIIDTTGEITSLDDQEAQMLLTEDALITKKSGGRTETYPLKEVKEFELSAPIAKEWMDAFASWVPWIVFPVALFGEFFLRIFLALIYAVIGLIIASATGARLTFGGIMSIAIVSMTVPMILNSVLLVTGTSIPFISLITFGISANGAAELDADFPPIAPPNPPA